MVVVKGVLKAKRVAHWQLPVFGKALQGLGRLRGPATATCNDKRLFSRQQHLAELAQAAWIAPSLHGLDARNRTRCDFAHQHVLRQHNNYRPRPSIHGSSKSSGYIFRHALRVINALHPLGHATGAGAKEVEVVQLLKRFAISKVAAHVAYKQNHRRAVLESRVEAYRRVGSPRPARDKTNAWTAA